MKKFLLILVLAVMCNSVVRADGHEYVEKWRSIFKECGFNFESKNIPATVRECVIRKTNKLAGKNTYKEAYCQRSTTLYYSSAIARDQKAPLDQVIKFAEKSGKGLIKKLDSGSIKRKKLKEIFRDMRKTIKYVYAHPNKTPEQLRDEQYFNCMNTVRSNK